MQSTGLQSATGAAADARAVRWWGRTWVRLTVCFIFVTTVPLTITAIYTTRRHLAVVREVASRAALERARGAAQTLEDALASARNDVLAVAEWPILESYLSSRDDSRDDAFWGEKLQVQLRTFMELNPVHRNIVVADQAGQVLMRVRRRGTTTAIVHSTEPNEPWLTSTLERAATLLPRQTDLRPMPSESTKPAVVCAARVPRAVGEVRAVVMLEIDIEPLLRSLVAGIKDRRVAILDPENRVLHDSNSESTEPAWPPMRAGQFIDAEDRLISTAAVDTGAGQASRGWTLAMAEPATVAEAGVADYRSAFLNVLFGSLVLAVVLGVWISRQVTHPVRRLYEASQEIGRGNFDVSLPGDSGDELGALTHQVKVMVSQLRDAHETFERRLRESAEELVQAERLATIGRTAASVAHEINNPSGIISLYAQMLVERLPAGDANVEKLRIIDAKAREISSIVRELLDYARKPAPVREWIETRSLLSGALDAATALSDAQLPVSPIATEVIVDDAAAKTYADPNQLTRVLRNLITNACHAMPRGGTVTLRCRRDDSSATIIEVSDTGTGISPEQVQHLFDPFYSTKRFGAGTGLGLAISKEIVERHEGSIEVSSAQGRGTTVTIRLPDGNVR